VAIKTIAKPVSIAVTTSLSKNCATLRNPVLPGTTSNRPGTSITDDDRRRQRS